jgi:hypothetical protein
VPRNALMKGMPGLHFSPGIQTPSVVDRATRRAVT